ncbi:hypothetical protein [Paenibacillus campi]|uniref:hypothetical protein n=1 Tax=Paenibacillus campi TaxID=3106031 RepID=UPI002AFFE27A|nr:hypothetical protein [Paenibacillus sp. SGZ-1009]
MNRRRYLLRSTTILGISAALLSSSVVLPASNHAPIAHAAATSSGVDVTSTIEQLGQPFKGGPYARNVWDMQVYDGKIYLGSGNSSNSGPSPNAGPVPIIYFDPATSQFVTEQVVSMDSKTGKKVTRDVTADEQIDTFKIIKGKLYIPGNDSVVPGWKYGNFYERGNGNWTEYQNIPNALHVYDLAYYGGKLFAAIGTEDSPVVMMSGDDGKTWEPFARIDSYGSRAYKFFQFKGKLYAAAIIMPDNQIWGDETHVLAIDSNLKATQQKVNGKHILPGMSFVQQAGKTPYSRISKTVVVNNQLVYIAGELYNDSQTMPEALIAASNVNEGKRVQLPDAQAIPTDLLVRDNVLYVLAYSKQADGSYMNRVYKTRNLKQWYPVLQFKRDTYAKSLELLNGDFYFGLGTDTKPLAASAGQILRVKAAMLK